MAMVEDHGDHWHVITEPLPWLVVASRDGKAEHYVGPRATASVADALAWLRQRVARRSGSPYRSAYITERYERAHVDVPCR